MNKVTNGQTTLTLSLLRLKIQKKLIFKHDKGQNLQKMIRKLIGMMVIRQRETEEDQKKDKKYQRDKIIEIIEIMEI